MYISSVSAMAARRTIENGNTLQQPGLGAYLTSAVAMARRAQIENQTLTLPTMQQPGLGRYGGGRWHGRRIGRITGHRGGITDQCSGLWNDVRQDAPQLTLAQFLARVPQCRPALRCGDNLLSNGSIVPIACVSPLPVARRNNYQFLGAVSSTDLLSNLSSGAGSMLTSPYFTYIVGGAGVLLLIGALVGRKRKKRRGASGGKSGAPGIARRTTTTYAT